MQVILLKKKLFFQKHKTFWPKTQSSSFYLNIMIFYSCSFVFATQKWTYCEFFPLFVHKRYCFWALTLLSIHKCSSLKPLNPFSTDFMNVYDHFWASEDDFCSKTVVNRLETVGNVHAERDQRSETFAKSHSNSRPHQRKNHSSI